MTRTVKGNVWGRRTLRVVAPVLASLALIVGGRAAAQEAGALPGRRLDLERLVPASTLVYVDIADAAALRAGDGPRGLLDEFAPFGSQLWSAMAPQIDRAKGEFAERTGLSLDSALAMARGGVQLALLAPGPDRPRGIAVLGVDAEQERLARLTLARVSDKLAGHERGAVIIQAAHRGRWVHTVLRSEGEPLFAYVFLGESLALATHRDDLVELIDRALAPEGKPADDTLSALPAFAAVRDATVGDDRPVLRGFMNLAALIEQELLDDPGSDQSTAAALGLLQMRALGFALTAREKGYSARCQLYAPHQGGERRGVLGLLAQGPADLGLAKLAPRSAISFSAARLDLLQAFDQARDLVELDARGALDRELGYLERDYGLRLRDDLLATLGGDWFSTSFPSAAGGSSVTVFGVKLRDAQGLERALRGLAGLTGGGGFSSVTLAGRTYRYLSAPVGRLDDGASFPELLESLGSFYATGLTWTIEGDTLLFADMPHSLADYFEALEGGTFAESDGFKGIAESKASFVQTSDPRRTFGPAHEVLIRLAKLLEAPIRRAGVPADFNRLPRASQLLPHLGPTRSELTFDARGITFDLTSDGAFGSLDQTAVVAFGVGIVAAAAIPNLLEARMRANEAAAIATLRTLVVVQSLYRDVDKNGDGQANFAPTFEELARYDLIDAVLASGVRQGYRFELSATDSEFQVVATPVEPGRSGRRSFFVDDSGVIRFVKEGRPDAASPPIGG